MKQRRQHGKSCGAPAVPNRICSIPAIPECATDREHEAVAVNEPALQRASSGLNADQASGVVMQELTTPGEVRARTQRAFATTDLYLLVQFLLDAKLGAGYDENSINGHNVVLAAVESLKARDGMEALLATQMVVVHRHAMRCLAIAAAEGQSDMTSELFANRANRFLRTFTMQMEALRRYRSRGEQHFTVEHVHVHSGAQAVVGVVRQQKEGGRGGAKENEQ